MTAGDGAVKVERVTGIPYFHIGLCIGLKHRVKFMAVNDLVKQALQLEPAKRSELVEEILHSLDQPDPAVEAVWLEEAERRLAAYRAGKVKGVPAEDVVGKL